MKKNCRKILLFMAVIITAVMCMAMSASAASWGDYEYSVLDNGTVEITGYKFNESVTDITIPSKINGKSVTKIGGQAFYDQNIVSVTIPDSVIIIDWCAFSYCSDLANIRIPNSVTKIGASAFTNCRSLKSIEIPNSVTSIEKGVFSDCSSLVNVTISSNATSIGDDAFSNCESLKSIEIPNSVTSIGGEAFYGCSSLKSIEIPNSVTSIGKVAFYGCSSLKSITIGSGVEIMYDKFNGCESLESINVNKNNKNYSSDEKGLLFNKNKTELLCCPAGNKMTSYSIPKTVKKISDDAFYKCKNLASVIIPNGVTYIGKFTFSKCENLTSVTISNGVTNIGKEAFEGCEKLTEIFVPKSVLSIGEYALGYTVHRSIAGGNAFKHKNFVIKSYKGSAAEKYATDNGFAFTAVTHTHTNKTTVTKATLTKNGKAVTKCTVCGKVSKTTTIYCPKTFSLSVATYTYDGKVKTPTVTIKDSKGKALKKDTDYTVKYASGRKNIGNYTVSVTLKGNYSGSKNLTFKIVLAAPVVKFNSATATSISIKWATVAGALKYEIYRISGNAWKKVTTTSKTSYTVQSLKEGTVYKFKVRAVRGDVKGNFGNVLTTETPTSAKKTTTVSAISQSTTEAMKYLKEKTNGVKSSSLIPGLKRTVTASSYTKAITTCPSMTPQGLTVSGDYLLISAYCNCGNNHRSVIYVLDKGSNKYLSTVILDTSCHVGGIAKLGDYLWVCDSSKSDKGNTHILKAYKFSDIKSAVGKSYKKVSKVKDSAVGTKPSYMCTANGYLYVGTFSETSTTSTVYYYSVSGTKLTKKGSFKITGLSKIQGISIRDKYMVVTSSFGRENKSKVYVYKDSGKFKTNGKKYSSPVKKFSFPNMLEACYIDSSTTYFLFESGAALYRSSKKTMPLDKYVTVYNSKLGMK